MPSQNHLIDEAFAAWVRHAFGHSVPSDPTVDPPWYLADIFAPYLRLDDEMCASYLKRLCDAPLEILADYDDPQIAQGLTYVSDYYLRPLLFEDGPVERRSDVVRALAKLFARLFAVRCSESLGHLDEATDQPLNSLCYIWWDAFNYWGAPEQPERADLDAAILKVLRDTLAIDHVAVQESALHGLSHWHDSYSAVTEPIIDAWLATSPTKARRAELMQYAADAKCGFVN